jgi:hypothetical protein
MSKQSHCDINKLIEQYDELTNDELLDQYESSLDNERRLVSTYLRDLERLHRQAISRVLKNGGVTVNMLKDNRARK